MCCGVITAAAQRLTNFQTQFQLLGRQALLPGAGRTLVSDRLRVGDRELSRGDAVACGGQLGIVSACYQDGSDVGVLVESAEVRRWLAPHSAVVVCTGGVVSRLASQVVCCRAWKPLLDDELLVIVC